MNTNPKRKMTKKLSYFEDSGTDRKKYALLVAAYYDRQETAIKLIESDPDQINQQDPHSGLTALHIAIFRQNCTLVELLAKHPQTDVHLKDNFNRKAVDMLDYTADQVIFETIMDATYPEDKAYWDALIESGELDPEKPEEPAQQVEPEKDNPENNVVPFKPKDP